NVRKSQGKDNDGQAHRVKEIERALINARLQIGSLGAELDKKRDEVLELTRQRKLLEHALREKEKEEGRRRRGSSDHASSCKPPSRLSQPPIVPQPLIKITGQSGSSINIPVGDDRLWEIDFARSKALSLCKSAWRLAHTVKYLISPNEVDPSEGNISFPPFPPNEDPNLAQVMALLGKAEDGMTSAGDDLSSFFSKSNEEDSRWKHIESSLKSERDELSHRLHDLEILLSESQNRVTELEGEHFRVQTKAAVALAAQSESQARLDEGRESRTELQSRVKSLMEDRSTARKRIEDQSNQLTELESRIASMTVQRDESIRETDSLRHELARVRVEMEELEGLRRKRIQELEVEISRSCSSLARDESRLIFTERELAAAK
ncbi:hypothetical protein HDU67_005345, partial [Dinochytrium kinnereticum]